MYYFGKKYVQGTNGIQIPDKSIKSLRLILYVNRVLQNLLTKNVFESGDFIAFLNNITYSFLYYNSNIFDVFKRKLTVKYYFLTYSFFTAKIMIKTTNYKNLSFLFDTK